MTKPCSSLIPDFKNCFKNYLSSVKGGLQLNRSENLKLKKKKIHSNYFSCEVYLLNNFFPAVLYAFSL